MPTDRKSAVDAVLAAFTDVIGETAPRGPDTVPGDLGDWTSLAHVRLVHTIEQRLECELPERFLAVGPSLAELAEAASTASEAV